MAGLRSIVSYLRDVIGGFIRIDEQAARQLDGWQADRNDRRPYEAAKQLLRDVRSHPESGGRVANLSVILRSERLGALQRLQMSLAGRGFDGDAHVKYREVSNQRMRHRWIVAVYYPMDLAGWGARATVVHLEMLHC